MALGPDSADFKLGRDSFGDRIRNWFRGFRQSRHFAPNQVLTEIPDLDPLFIPRVPMRSDNIDPALMVQFRAMGYAHAQEITAETHPELYMGWQEMCRRAGFQRPLQLIVTDSLDPNAHDASESEVVISTGLMRMLNVRELLAVLGHELGHAKHEPNSNGHPLTIIGSALGGSWIGSGVGSTISSRFHHAYIPIDPATQAPYLDPRHGGVVIGMHRPNFLARTGLAVLHLGLWLGGGLTGWAIAHRMVTRPSELRADREGVLLSGDPEALISAFEKMKTLTSKEPSMKLFFNYAKSGYPTFGERIHRIQKIAQHLPAGQPPVYQMIEAMTQAPVPPEVEAAQARQLQQQQQPGPAAKVRGGGESERVVFVPENSVIH